MIRIKNTHLNELKTNKLFETLSLQGSLMSSQVRFTMHSSGSHQVKINLQMP